MAPRPSKNALRIGEWIADPDDDTLSRGADSVRIEPRMMRLLLCFAKSPGAVISQDTLLDDVWQGVVVGPASVYQAVSQLRKALGDTDTPATYIETVARKGYRLVAPVSAAPSAPVELPATDTPALAGQIPAQPVSLPTRRFAKLHVAAIVAAGVLLAVAAIFYFRRDDNAAPGGVDTIVVLPFTDMTAGNSEQPFCDGLTEELSSWLAQIPTLRVVARTSAFEFRERGIDVREVGRRLGATHILEGSLRRSGNVVRVTVQLIAAKDGYHLWSGSYDDVADDTLQVQEKIARAVAANLELQLTSTTGERFAQRRNNDPQAFRLYLIAQAHQQRRTQSDNDRAITLYRQALEIEPQFTLAQVGLAYAYLNQNYLNDRSVADIAKDAQPLLDDAARRSPDLPELLAVRGALRSDLGQLDAARADLLRALQLDPSLSRAASDLGRMYIVAGEPRDALKYYSLAANLEPLDTHLQSQRCMALTDLAQFEAAQSACEQARALRPESIWALSVASDLEEARGRPAQALKLTEIALRSGGEVAEIHADRGRWLMRLGLLREARAAYVAAIAATARADGTNLSLASLGLRTAFAIDGPAGLHREIAERGLAASSEPEVMFELAEAELMAGDIAAARAHVARALASPQLRADLLESPWYARNGRSYLLIAAAVERAAGNAGAAAGHLDAAAKLVDRLSAAGVRRHGLLLLTAEIAALRGNGDGAMRALNDAADLGWRYVWLAEQQPYFAALRERADYRALLARVRARNAADAAEVVKIAQQAIDFK